MKIARAFRILTLSAALLALGGSASRAFGNDHFARETVYASPIESAWVTPTAYIWPTSYYVPTAYATSYTVAPTAYVVPTVYAATAYTYTRGRRAYYAPTSYLSTAYYWPTSYLSTAYYWPTAYYQPTVAYYLPTVVDYPVVTAANNCDQAPTRVVRATPSSESSTSVVPNKNDAGGRQRPPANLDSETSTSGLNAPEGSVSSRVDQKVPAPGGKKAETPAGSETEKKKNAGRLDSLDSNAKDEQFTPLSAPPAEAEKEKVKDQTPPAVPEPAREPASKTSEVPSAPVPAPPADGNPGTVPLDLPPLGETMLRREARKPVGGTPSAFTKVLNGIVKSGDTGERVEGVPITLTNRLSAYPDRALETDAYGRFAVRLADGDWDVRVTMPSGRVYTVSRLSVSNGKIVDDQGRNIPSLIITR